MKVMIQVSDNDHPKDPSDKYTSCIEMDTWACIQTVWRLERPSRPTNGHLIRWYIEHDDGTESHHGDSDETWERHVKWINKQLLPGCDPYT